MMDRNKALEIEIANLEAILGDRDTEIQELKQELVQVTLERDTASFENRRIERSYQNFIRDRWAQEEI